MATAREPVQRPATVNPPLTQVSVSKPEDEKPADEKPAANGAEVVELRKQLEEYKSKDKARSKALRTLAATILMPATESDGGASRKNNLRTVLLDVVNHFAPDTEEE